MDEDAETNVDNKEYAVRNQINRERKKDDKTCRTRFDKLATPKKRFVLALYQNHAYHLPRDKLEKLKQFLQELYAMTPEETEKYFLQLREEAGKNGAQSERKDAFKFIETLLKCGMMHAFNNPVPPLISVRLRNLSDIILEQICDLRNIDHPDRDDPDQTGLFLLSVADWIAIAIEHVYYGVQLKKNAELEEIEETKVDRVEIPDSAPIIKEIDYDVQGGEDGDLTGPDIE
ncbi:hypothetical protein NQ314_019723 [Rhamnusium bicolor]|uniref:Uncharacterized protein n=1 Tax=Rhamnusium bicolor TaxID=1586634 RepID=A0AAV8WM29_9CUCU|nr:hypothetical protein NQ314_019723 [Rhamnusium bicolor]